MRARKIKDTNAGANQRTVKKSASMRTYTPHVATTLFEQSEIAKCTVCGKVCKSHPGFVAHVKRHAETHPAKVRAMFAASKRYQHKSPYRNVHVEKELVNGEEENLGKDVHGYESVIQVSSSGRTRRRGAGQKIENDYVYAGDMERMRRARAVRGSTKLNVLPAQQNTTSRTCEYCG